MFNRVKAAYRAFRNPSTTAPAAKSYDPYLVSGGYLGFGGYTVGDNQDILWNKWGAALAAVINHAAFACVNKRAETVGAARWRMVSIQGDEVVAEDNDYSITEPTARAIKRYAERNDGVNLFYLWHLHKAITGESFIQLLWNRHGFPADLEYLNSLMTTVQRNGNVIHSFQYSNGNRSANLQPRQVVYDRYHSNIMSEVDGYSPILAVIGSGAVNVMKSAGRATLSYFQNDGMPGHMVVPNATTTPQGWSERELNIISNAMSRNKGAGNKYRTQVFPYPVDTLDFETPDLQKWAELLSRVEPQIYTAFRTPRSVAGDSDSTRYQASPDDVPNFHELIVNELTAKAAVVNARIVPFFYPDENPPPVRFEFDLSPYQHIKADDANLAKDALLVGAITVDEYRMRTGFEPLEAGGDVFYLPSNITIVPKQKLLETAVQETTPAAAPDQGTEEKATGLPLFMALDLANNPDLTSLQARLKEVITAEGTEWNAPETFHCTLMYIPAIDQESARRIVDALPMVEVPEMMLSLASLRTFDNVGNHAVHFRIRENTDLREVQESLYHLCADCDAQMSSYSDPNAFTPHVTMCYTPERMRMIAFNGKATVQPLALYAVYGEEEIYRKPIESPPEPPQPQPEGNPLSELSAWRKRIENRGILKGLEFAPKSIPDEVAGLIRLDLQGAGDTPYKSIFEKWANVLKARQGTLSLPDDLPAPVKALIDDLQSLEVDTESIRSAAEALYTEMVAIKALATTRNNFEAECQRQMMRAFTERTKKSVFIKNMLVMLTRYSRLAYSDGYADAGSEIDLNDDSDEEVVAANVWLKTFVNDQEQYVRSIADALYADDMITEDEIASNRPEMWWNKSVMPAYNEALMQAAHNKRLEWRFGDAEHCHSCRVLNGIVLTAKRWRDEGIEPQSSLLECKGFKCKCKFVVTNKKKHRGRLPNWRKALELHTHDQEVEDVQKNASEGALFQRLNDLFKRALFDGALPDEVTWKMNTVTLETISGVPAVVVGKIYGVPVEVVDELFDGFIELHTKSGSVYTITMGGENEPPENT